MGSRLSRSYSAKPSALCLSLVRLLLDLLVARAAQSCQWPSNTREVKWNHRVLPNAASGPWHPFFRDVDPGATAFRRTPSDPKVVELKAKLRGRNCIPGLKILSPKRANYSAHAARIFRRDGFVVVRDVLDESQLNALRNATCHVLGYIFQADPEGSFGGGAGKLPHRYSLGDASGTRAYFHLPEFCALIDLPETTPVLRAIFGSDEYLVAGSGGDVALAGAVEYQKLHMDAIWDEHEGRVQDMLVPPVVTINFVIEDLTAINGPMRKVPGSHKWKRTIPSLADEPDSMTLSTLCPIPAGAVIFRDNRVWHGGTPNLSDRFRALPNIEYFAPGIGPSIGWLDRATMPGQNWHQLTPFGQYIARGLVAQPGEEIHGAGRYSPAAVLDIMPFMKR